MTSRTESPSAQSRRPEPRYYAIVQMMMYYTIQDFARAAEWAESEIKRLDDAAVRREPRSDGDPVQFGDTFISLKTVSHFNLGIAMELLLKYFLRWEALPVPRRHPMKDLYAALPKSQRDALEALYHSVMPDTLTENVMTLSPYPKGKAPLGRRIHSLSAFFEYLDADMDVAKMRYAYESFDRDGFAHYLPDISPFLEFIRRAPKAIQDVTDNEEGM